MGLHNTYWDPDVLWPLFLQGGLWCTPLGFLPHSCANGGYCLINTSKLLFAVLYIISLYCLCVPFWIWGTHYMRYDEDKSQQLSKWLTSHVVNFTLRIPYDSCLFLFKSVPGMFEEVIEMWDLMIYRMGSFSICSTPCSIVSWSSPQGGFVKGAWVVPFSTMHQIHNTTSQS